MAYPNSISSETPPTEAAYLIAELLEMITHSDANFCTIKGSQWWPAGVLSDLEALTVAFNSLGILQRFLIAELTSDRFAPTATKENA